MIAGHISLKGYVPSPGSNGKPVLGLDAVKSHTLQTPTHLDFLTRIKEVWTSPSSLSKLFARSSKFCRTRWEDDLPRRIRDDTPIPLVSRLSHTCRSDRDRYDRAGAQGLGPSICRNYGQISSYTTANLPYTERLLSESNRRLNVGQCLDGNGYCATPTGTLYPKGIPCIIWAEDAINQSMKKLPTCCR